MIAPASALAAGGTSVTVRVEGLKRTLLAPTVVHTKTGWITKAGTPRGQCPATSATGALDVATHHRWNGNYGSVGLAITSILGETHTFTSPYYWSVWVDGKFAQSGACQLKLHRGEQVLFAAVSDTFNGYPLVIVTPRTASTGKAFTVKVDYVGKTGKLVPLAGATVSVAGHSGKTDSHGTVPLTAHHAGLYTLKADKPGYIRAAPVRVRVTG